MKKQIIIIFLVLFNADLLWSQEFIKTTTPVTEEFLQNVHGRWLDFGAGLNANISKQQQQEILSRIGKIHQFVFNIYPTPIGVDAAQARHTTDEQFAFQVKLDPVENGAPYENHINGIPVVEYWYTAYFGRYFKGRNEYEMLAGLPSEDAEWLFVYANSLNFTESGAPEMNIDGRKIQMMPVVKGTWKGHTLYIPQTGSGKMMILLHRDGMLPYTPVTRKQFLDKSISYFNQMFDGWTSDIDKTAKTFIDAGMTDAQTIKEKKDNLQKQKKDVIKHYKDELAATSAAGLLDEPAIIPLGLCDPDVTRPIFTTQEAGGRLLVTENPAYIRKDLPKYVPQFFILTFEWPSWSAKLKNDPLKIEYENFPIEKLQAMIDK